MFPVVFRKRGLRFNRRQGYHLRRFAESCFREILVARMACKYGVMKLGWRQALWAIVVSCCFVGALPSANASCGDHLAGSERHSFAGARPDTKEGRGGYLHPQRLPQPCHGPQCRKLPFKPIPVDLPVVSPLFRQDCVPPMGWMIGLTAGLGFLIVDLDPPIPSGFKQPVERPPARV